MSRWFDRDEREKEESGPPDGLSRAGGETRPRVQPEMQPQGGFGANRRERILVRSREYHIRPSERAALDALGQFRVIDAADLAYGVYGNDGRLAHADFKALGGHGLVEFVSLRDAKRNRRRVLTLTRDGHAVAMRSAPKTQQLHWGFVKPAELEHDSRLYRAYRHEERQLIAEGKSVTRVVLDYELKREHFSRVNKPDDEPYRKRQWESARELHLAIIEGHVVFPDFRIEYEDERGAPGRVDVEVATGDYRGDHITVKGAAGFHIYADGGLARRFRVENGPLLGGRFAEERSAVLLL